MPAIKMTKIAVAAHQSQKDAVMSVLQKTGTVQITSQLTQQSIAQEHETGDTFSFVEIEKAISLLSGIEGQKKSFVENFAPYKEPISRSELKKTATQFDLAGLLKSIDDAEATISAQNTVLAALDKERQAVAPWVSLDIKLRDLYQTQKTKLLAGSVPIKKEKAFARALQADFPFSAHCRASCDKDRAYYLVFYLKETGEIGLSLSKYGFVETAVPISDRSAGQETDAIDQAEKEALIQKTRALDALKRLVPKLKDLRRVYDYLRQEQIKTQTARFAEKTEHSFCLTGWARQDKLDLLRSELKKNAPTSALDAIEPEEGEQPPVVLKNHPLLYPFELITSIFGFPGSGEVDPTAPLSFFYLLFFAMCLSDVGYGVILAAASVYYLKTLTLSEGGKKLLLLLFMGGIATIFVGMLTGSYFGIELSSVPAPLGPALLSIKIIDPIQNPLSVLILSVGLGLLQNLFGVFVSMIAKIKKGDIISGIFDDGLWIFFISVLSAYAASFIVAPFATSILAKLSIGGAVALVLTKGRAEKSIVKKIMSGVLSLYNTTGFLGDTLSYSRLLALMMTTAIIGMVINLIASLTAGIPFVGYLIMIVILVFGHLFNLVISVLSAFIHSARLQLVEFFGKFYEGSGKEFKPLKYDTKYVVID